MSRNIFIDLCAWRKTTHTQNTPSWRLVLIDWQCRDDSRSANVKSWQLCYWAALFLQYSEKDGDLCESVCYCTCVWVDYWREGKSLRKQRQFTHTRYYCRDRLKKTINVHIPLLLYWRSVIYTLFNFSISLNGIIKATYLILDCRDWLLVASLSRHPGCSVRKCH